MEFFDGGPDVPDDLVSTQLAGDVVFVVGAGVSARSGLPLFGELVQRVYARLGQAVPQTPDTLADAAETDAWVHGEWDRTLGLLERRLVYPNPNSPQGQNVVRETVAAELQLPRRPSAAHVDILDISRDVAGRPRVVTTNFDVLFERASEKVGLNRIASSVGPGVPAVGSSDFHGVMHLHGRIANARLGIAASNLVLTSADFGEAYLRSGWASSFVYDLLRRYALVFVGYSADDPPMRYMLEATEAGRLYFRDLRRAYAFAPFDDNSASDEGNVFARWRAKGLVPILYQNCDQSHDSLYRSLSAWAKCARDPGAWAGAEIARIAGTPFAATSERTRAKVKYLTTTMSNATALSNCAGSPDWIECLIDKNSPPYLRERDANLWYAQRLADQAAVNREKRGLGKPETFNFLGFTFICGKSRGGRFLVHRKTRRDRMQAKLKEVKEQLRRRRHQPIPEQGKWLRQVVTGHFVYYAVPTNSRALSAFRQHVTDLWRRTLRRRSQRDGTTWDRMAKLSDDWLPKPHILHPWPSQRFAVTHPR